ncbi:uncharacterized protein LOC108332045 isoform X2 [Vigna angularis]|nr:uncharacterized protein LOC108332045 isoform X2 [Vigna angularis]XP_052728132.1 uncharacterized protein LOC108332045 isoform X2 [Vigna angularis]
MTKMRMVVITGHRNMNATSTLGVAQVIIVSYSLTLGIFCVVLVLFLLWLSVNFVDVIEEDALNMESCIRVLRILITKADTEIEELERDLLVLQKELACFEHEKWPDIFCGVLSERISQLDVAIRTLKNDCADEAEVQLLLDSEPAGTLHEILAQYLDVNVLSPVVNVTEHAPDKDSSTLNMIIKDEGQDLHGTSESSGSLELILEIQKSDNPEKIEELSEETLVRSPDLAGIILASYHSDGIKLSETFDDQVAGNEVRKSQLINSNTGQMLDLFSAKSEAKKENEFVREKDVSPDEFRPAIDINGKKTGPHSILDTSQRQKRAKPNLDKEPCDFAPKAAQRDCKKEPKVAPDEDLNSLNYPLQVVYPKTLCITDTEFCSVKDSNGMHTKSSLYTGLQLMDVDEDKGKEHEQDLKSQLRTNLRKSKMSFPSKLKASEKKELELKAFSSREPFDSCTEVIPSASIVVSAKSQRRSKSCTDVTILNESMKRKIITKGAVKPDKHETEGRAIVLYDSKFSELQKKRRVTKLPITVDIQNSSVNLDVPNSDGVSMDKKSKLAPRTHKSHSLVDSHDETLSLNSLSLTDLRAMAKEHNVRKYYKLRKVDLVEQLAQRLSSC